MKTKLVFLTKLSGTEASIYSIFYAGTSNTLFDRFIQHYRKGYTAELMNIAGRLRSIGNTTSAIESFFKLDEGLEWDDMVCALYDIPDKHLRLYCIRFSEKIVVIGSGGPKPGSVRAWQDDPVLSAEVHEMMQFSGIIRTKLDHGALYLSDDELRFEGDLNLTT